MRLVNNLVAAYLLIIFSISVAVPIYAYSSSVGIDQDHASWAARIIGLSVGVFVVIIFKKTFPVEDKKRDEIKSRLFPHQ